jgi:hypothetical protein
MPIVCRLAALGGFDIKTILVKFFSIFYVQYTLFKLNTFYAANGLQVSST